MTNLHETFAALLDDLFPDADDVAFAELVDECVECLAAFLPESV